MLIIFDLDGTLVDSLPDLSAALNRSLGRVGYALRTTQEVRRFIGDGTEKLLERACHPQAVPPTLCEDYRTDYQSHLLDRTRPYAGLAELLERLSEKATLAVLSNKFQSAVEEIVEHFFPGSFSYVFGEQRPRKPDPIGVKKLMALSGENIDTTCLVGDSSVDRATAEAAGIRFFPVSWGYGDGVGAADSRELENWLDSFCQIEVL